MPCCVIIVHFQRCQHNILLKLGCTNNCEELCPPEKQYALVIARYLWLCEGCHERKSNIELDDRCNKWADLMMDIPECLPEYRIAMEDAIRRREDAEDEICEKKRVQCIEEIQWVIDWTQEYGLVLYDVFFKKTWEPRRAAARIRQLRGLRLWDVFVVKDVSRHPKILFEDQTSEIYWYITEQFDEQYMLRKQLQQSPGVARPPVPLFHCKDEETEGQASESCYTPDSEEEENDGDAVPKGSDDGQVSTEQRSATLLSPVQKVGHPLTHAIIR